MKKAVGVIMVVVAIAVAFSFYVLPNLEEASTVEAVKAKMVATSINPSTESANIPQHTTQNAEVVPTEKPAPFPWVSQLSIESIVGTIEIANANVATTVTFGASESWMISNSAGIHEQLSSEQHLVVLGHHMSNGSIFANLLNVVEGDEIILTTEFGTYRFVASSVLTVEPEEYKNDNYDVLSDGDMSLATCEYLQSGVKARRIVICDLLDA